MNFFNQEPKAVSLASTRKGQFFYLHRYYISIISFLSFFSFLFFLPFLGYLIFFEYQVAYFSTKNDVSSLLSFITYYSLIFIPLLMIVDIALTGCFYVNNKLTLDIPASIKDYFKGIKENYVRSILPSFLFGLSFYFLFLDLNYSLNMPSKIKGLQILISIISVLQFLLVSNFYFLSLSQNARYNLKYKDLLKNSLILSFSKFYLSIGVLLLSYLPLLIYFFAVIFTFNNVVIVVGFVILFLVYFGYSTLLLEECHQYLFDEVINKTNIIKEYRRGLLREEN